MPAPTALGHTTSNLFIRPADLEIDKERLLTLLRRNLIELDHQKRFNWLYLDNPAGQARTWFVCDESAEHVVGSASVFPRHVWIGDELHLCGQVGDFAVDIDYRSLGPALLLQRATFTPVNDGQLAFCYDCPPHDRGMAPFQRLGMSPVCRMARFAKPLTVDEIVRRRVPGGLWIQAPVATAANLLLRLRDLNGLRAKGLSLEPHAGPFGQEFTYLDRAIGGTERVVRSRRFAEDMNWRYLRDPLCRYRVVTARRQGALEGYAALRNEGTRALLVEVRALTQPVRHALAHAITLDMRADQGSAIDALTVFPSVEADFLMRAGFRFRELAQHVVPYASPGSKHSELHLRKWQFSGLDVLG